MGEIQWRAGDLYGAQENLSIATHTLDPSNKAHQQELEYTYNLLGNVSLELKHYDEAIAEYNKALDFCKESGDSTYSLDVMNGKALAFQKKGNYKDAVITYDSMLRLIPDRQDLLARIIDNRAITTLLSDTNANVLPEFLQALQIRNDAKDSLGLYASYGHLADYYLQVNPDSALWYTQKLYDLSKQNHNPLDRLNAIDKFVRLNTDPSSKDHWFLEFKKLNDSFQFAKDTTRNRFAEVKYDFQKEKANRLALQQDIARQRLWIVGLIIIAVISIAGIYNWNNKRRKRIKRESENAIRDARLKTSKKVHDVVANGLYGIMNELEHNRTIELEPLLDKIEGLYEKSRDISYEDIAVAGTLDYNKQIHQLLDSFNNDQTKLLLIGNEQKYWDRISAFQKPELKLVLHEIMVNMKKHSQAKNIVIQFTHDNNKGFIDYKDDGVGFSTDLNFGNGLNNTVSRIKSINGDITFGKSEKGGAAIAISFPLESSKT